ncbi:MAG: diapolycopene oxygenase [Ignavibacteriae bacterium HGW-Ignavibacteriae-1]|jgi:diapolycopene oxygenase|nr:MAG: diapolycopene oxygenase [Ignavibacteriae bacterium HGW-Ignavibacteriae-1]
MSENSTKKKVIIIGAGLGGISAAIMLKINGYDVEIFEKNEKIGGKLNTIKENGYTFDLGPSILTLPQYFKVLFEASGRDMSDYIPIQEVRPHWRNFFEDGTVIDLDPDMKVMKKELDKLGPDAYSDFRKFMEYSEKQYDILAPGYFDSGLDSTFDFMKFYDFSAVFKIDFFRTMHGRIAKIIKNPYLIDIFDYFIKYVGSSAYNAPGFMNLMPTIQFRYGLWYVPGGMYNIALGFKKYMDELGIKVHFNSEVTKIIAEENKVNAIEVNGKTHYADIIVSNMEVIPAYKDLLNEDDKFLGKMEKFEPSCSGLVLDIGLDIQYPQLAHHNFLYSQHQKEHFDLVFNKKMMPTDPTIYLVDSSKSDPSVAPPNCSGLKILPHIPYINEENPYTMDDYIKLKDTILIKLERMGLTDLRKHIVYEHLLTPIDIEKMYKSNKGSIYGVVSDFKKNFAFKLPKKSKKYKNLYFTGGTVNPGAGMPMVLLCGQNVCKAIIEDDKKNGN